MTQISYTISRPRGGPVRAYDSRRLTLFEDDLTPYWILTAFEEGGGKSQSLFVVDQNTLIAAKDAVLWKLSAMIWADQWDVLYHLRQGYGPEKWIFTLMRGADVQRFVITNAETVDAGAPSPPRAELPPCSVVGPVLGREITRAGGLEER